MRPIRIALYGDINLNIIDGSAIWLASLVQVLHRVEREGVEADSLRCTVSLGVGSYAGEGFASPADFLSATDEALYAAKHAGRNQVKVALFSSPVPAA